jgi:hypothetical protein
MGYQRGYDAGMTGGPETDPWLGSTVEKKDVGKSHGGKVKKRADR